MGREPTPRWGMSGEVAGTWELGCRLGRTGPNESPGALQRRRCAPALSRANRPQPQVRGFNGGVIDVVNDHGVQFALADPGKGIRMPRRVTGVDLDEAEESGALLNGCKHQGRTVP